MQQSIAHIALVVRDYDEALDFYVAKLGFRVLQDTFQPEQNKRWVVISPPGSSGTSLLLARASKPEQEAFIGNQAGGRVFLFLHARSHIVWPQTSCIVWPTPRLDALGDLLPA